VERNRYNESARELNAYIRAIPGRIWASVAGVERREYFEVSTDEAREAPKVNFDSKSDDA
jgi:hypothetical protein